MDQPLILAIETATGCGSVALTSGDPLSGALLAEATAQPRVTHARRLLGSVEWVLGAGGVSWEQLDGIAVSLGPGSFTGLRIGMAAAKGLAMAAGVPLLGVPTLDALACTALGVAREKELCCLLDARKNEVYAALYRSGDDGLPVRSQDPVVIGPEQLVAKLTGPTVFAGPGVAAFHEIFAGSRLIEILPPPLCQPRAAFVGLLGGRMLALGDVLEPAAAAPLYIRASDAELNFKARRQPSAGNTEPRSGR
ncbi:tRNA (adenosine(37)-N6)-threonylcarbamoyltransferase complex dimerization subunit type 1 TsaB [Desulfolithobacter dissulfuricans]|uniref:N(6)-L-threonylcarbamoyladenine synthase n=1 Tax=Desulfolithobacter dissulfuricans TaxID=2795293 RepID=A0A915XIK7_9BACT|nr:tRNA (adenosine(37)-N6)-threonylcarbamoyltransferase complex dimerization subunit type 1 TsaB [Desulfolithobacter dissulfuricans]BCO09934.1 tRNA (adenosine(37)-N6)-threonylcarbamoyltransferase complex dimerization subunit type 1 TsaB [Desulfolithobacter dissulfuricans]